MANIGMGQLRKPKDKSEDGMIEELPLVTCGDDISTVSILATVEKPHYTATDVLNYMLAT